MDQEPEPLRVKPSVAGAIRTFAHWIADGAPGHLGDIDYWETMREEPSLMEQVFAIYCNVLRLDAEGDPTNPREAGERAAQYIRQYLTGVEARPAWQDWELNRHEVFGGVSREDDPGSGYPMP